jgi:hypothetical protein
MNARFDAPVWAGVERRLAEVERFIPEAPPSAQRADAVASASVRAGTAFGRPSVTRSPRRQVLMLVLTVVAALLALIAAVLLVGAPNTEVDRREEPFGPFGIYRSSNTRASAAVLTDGRVLIVSGTWEDLGSDVAAGTDIWVPVQGRAATGAPSVARVMAAATLLLDGRVLVTGGFGGPYANYSSAVASAEIWDPSSGAFSATGSMAQERVGHTATLLSDGRVLVIGGTEPKGSPTSAEIWDEATGGFTPAGDLARLEGADTATLLPSGDVLVIGSGAAELWQSATGTFRLASGDLAAAGFWGATATGLLDGRVVIMPRNTEGRPPSAFITSDGLTAVSVGSLLQPRMRYAATLLWDGRVLITGGVGTWLGPPLASVEVFDPADGQFREAPPLAQPVDNHTALLLPDGQVLIVFDVNGPDGHAEPFIYDPNAL